MLVNSLLDDEIYKKGYRNKEISFLLSESNNLRSVAVLHYEKDHFGCTHLLKYLCHSKNVKRTMRYYFFDAKYLYDDSLTKIIEKIEPCIKSIDDTCCLVIAGINGSYAPSMLKALVALKNMYVSKICTIVEIVLPNGTGLENLPHEFKLLFSKNYFFLDKMNPQDLKNTVLRNCKIYNVKFSASEIKKICEKSGGDVTKIRELIAEKHIHGFFPNTVNQKSKDNKNLVLKDGSFYIGEENLDSKLTKNESIVLKTLLSKKGTVLRDEIALALSPESGGEGVSNASVDQIISRLRKKLRLFTNQHFIQTIRGRGYSLVSI